jgi:endonuclease/exonuclease/phosphatase family metal-dependent hydrolase
MKIMTYNIMEGGTGRVDPLAEVIRLAGADVVVVQEAVSEEGSAAFHKLADRLGMDRFLAESGRAGGGAVGILSRVRIKEAVNHSAMDPRLSRGAVSAIVGDLVVIGVHLHPRELFADEEVRVKELTGVFEVANLFAGREHVICGDFNASHPLQKIDLKEVRDKTRERVMTQGGEFPREVVRRMLERGYVDAHALHHSAEAFGCSFTTAFPAMRVDYMFVTAGLAPKVKGCEVFRPEMGRFASDHYPVVAELVTT